MKLIIENEKEDDAHEIVELMEKLQSHPLVKNGRINLTLEGRQLHTGGEYKTYL